MRIAIVGGGIAGLTAARELHGEHEITLFEAGDHAGGHTNTVPVEIGGEAYEIDTGFIVFNRPNYPRFSRMLDDLGVATKPTDMSFSVRCDRTGLEWCGSGWNRIFAQRRNLLRPGFLGMLRDVARFCREAPRILEEGAADLTVDEYLAREGYGRRFAEHYLVPMGAALWSCPSRGFRRFPVRFVVEFFENHGMLLRKGRPEWLVVTGGSRRYVDEMTRPFTDRIRLHSPVTRVRRHPDRVDVTVASRDPRPFDRVVIACHADQALRMLADPTPAETAVLSAFPYLANEAVLHTDESVLPRSPRARASWNYHVRADDPDRVAVTYDMNRLMGLDAPHRFLVTLNDDEGIDPAKVIRRIAYHHPTFRPGRDAALARRPEILGANRTTYCGAYFGYGFHEDGVASAHLAVRSLVGERAEVTP